MNTYKVTVYIETPYGAIVPEVKFFKANNIRNLYDLLKEKGYQRYFIGSLLEEAITF